mgnify:CR=1 FL=1
MGKFGNLVATVCRSKDPITAAAALPKTTSEPADRPPDEGVVPGFQFGWRRA